MKTVYRIACLFLYLLSIHWTASAVVWYVKPGGTGTGSGSWGNAAAATQLATIIAGAASGDQVWVVGSTTGTTYYPTTGTSRTAAFVLKSGVAVYGGFAGTETALGQQDPAIYLTILSGDIGVVGNNTDNSYHVVVSANNTGTTVLDGFTIENGNANGSATATDDYNGIGFSGDETSGAGILLYQTTLTVTGCIFTQNTASGNGAGGFGEQSTITISGSTFSNNTSSAEGGGMMVSASGGGSYTISTTAFTSNRAGGNGGGFCEDNGSVAINLTDCSFKSNSTSVTGYNPSTGGNGGGGVYVTNSSIVMTGCTLSGNSSSGYGGGMILTQGSNQPIKYCTFTANNAAALGGGLACTGGSAPTVANCNFSSNAALEGAGIYCISGQPSFVSDTLFGNTANASSGTGGGGICSDTSANPVVSHCWFNANVTNGGNGAGMYEQSSSQDDSNCVFQANIAKGSASNGGGLYHLNGTSKVYNSVFVNNSCTGGYGGGIYTNNANTTYEHLTMYNNFSTASTATTPYGDGIYVAGGSPKIDNDIVWSTTATSVGVVYVSTITTYKVQYSDIEGGTLFATLTGNITSPPSFGASGDPVGLDNIWATADDGLHLTGSAAADAVTPGNFLTDDITDAARPDAGSVNADMGAYEGGGTFVALAIQLLNFTALPAGNNTVILNWKVDAAGQVTQYQVQKSVNGTDFQAVGTVDAVDGWTSYSWTDANATATITWYRLLILRADGGEGYSATVVVRNVPAGEQELSLRPSIGQQGATTLYIGSPQATTVNLALLDAAGRVLYRRSVAVGQGPNNITLDVSGFARGIYFVHVSGDGGGSRTLPFEKL